MFFIKFADDCCRKWPLWQLSHYYYPFLCNTLYRQSVAIPNWNTMIVFSLSCFRFSLSKLFQLFTFFQFRMEKLKSAKLFDIFFRSSFRRPIFSPFQLHHILFTIFYSPCSIHSVLFNLFYSLYSIQSNLLTLFYSLFSIHHILFTLFYSLCTIHSVLFTLFYSL